MLNFRKDQKVGTFRNPLVISGGEATDISALAFGENSQLTVYSLTGLLVYQGQAAEFDRKRLTRSDVYVIREVTSDSQVRYHKVTELNK
jgi:hypothetical protein